MELSTPARGQAGNGRGVGFRRGRHSRKRACARGRRVQLRARARGVLRAEDRPAHDGLAGPSWQIGTDAARFADAEAFQPRVRGRRTTREHTPYDGPPRPARLHRALHGDPDRALRRRLPALARPGAGPDPPGCDGAPSGAEEIAEELRQHGFRARREAPDETLGKRIRAAEVEKIPYVVVYGDRESRDSLALRHRHGEQSTVSLDALLDELRTAGTL